MKTEGASTKKKKSKGVQMKGASEGFDSTGSDLLPAKAPSGKLGEDGLEGSTDAGSTGAAPSGSPTGSTTVGGDARANARGHAVQESLLDDDRRMGQIGLGAVALVLVGATLAGLILGPATAVLVLAAGAFVAVISLFWSSLRTLLGETPLSGADAYAIGAPRAEEEQKRAVLRALKDLEFERSVGKISEEDYRRLVSHYRGQAKLLLRALDEETAPLRERAEELVRIRMKEASLSPNAASFRNPGKWPAEREREELEENNARELREAAVEEAPRKPQPAEPSDEAVPKAPSDASLATVAEEASDDLEGPAETDKATSKEASHE